MAGRKLPGQAHSISAVGLMAQDIDTGTNDVLGRLERGVLTLTFNRPQARNALNRGMHEAIARQLATAETDPEVRCVVLTGAVNAFCAGGDVKLIAELGDGTLAGDSMDVAIHGQRIRQRATVGKLFTMPKPTIAALPGAAAGAGLSYALACDLRIMSSTAFMTTAFARVGFSGDFGGSFFLSQLVGAAKARELYFLSERVSAEEALRLGLTNWICEPESLPERTQEIALRLAQGPAIAYRYMKENLNRALGDRFGECLDQEVPSHLHCGQTLDHQEAAKAFVEKRQPVFQGR